VIEQKLSPAGAKRVLFLALLCATLLLPALPARAIIDITLQMQLGNPSGAIADTNNHDHYLVQRTVEALDFSDNFGEPVWASWDLTSADVGSAQRQDNYRPDTNLPPNFYEVTDTDYNGVGNIDFNRGHMCPSEDRTDTTNDNSLLFFMDNIIPQAATNNQGVWGNFESYCRTQASGGNELLIICGPSGFGTNRIPSGKAAIPNYTWKTAVVVPLGSGSALSRITAACRVISLKIPNSNNVVSTWQTYVTNAATIENDTGFSFFTALPPNMATVFRNVIDGQTPPAPAIAGFSPSGGTTNTSVTISGTNFVFATNVTFNGVSATFTINSSNSITATVPPGATTGPIKVWGLGGNVTSSSSFVITGATAPDLAVLLNHPANFTVGDIGDTYTIIVTNVGTAASSGSVTVTDALPAGLTATAISGAGWTTNLATLTAMRSDTLAAGSAYPAITVTVNVANNAPASVTNMATVSGGGDGNSANNTANDLTTINGVSAPDLTVIAFHVGNFTQGDLGDTYTIIVTNVGSAASSGGITITDALPSGLTATAISGAGWTTNLATLTATRSDTLATGSAYPAITVTVNVATNAPAAVTNVVTVSGGGESNMANDTANDPTTINAIVPGGTATNIVISQIYGGGGNASATYQNDFVELFNPLSVAVNLGAWSVQYAASTGTSWSKANLVGTLQPHHYYLVELASNAAVGATLPVADATNTSINMSATSGKVALVSNQTALSGSNPVGTNGVVDFVGFGSANAFEGTAAAPGPSSGNNTTSILRNNGGYADSNNNSSDFSLTSPPTPRNSSSPANPSGVADLVVALSHSGNFTQGDTNDSYTLIVTNTGAVASSGTVTVADSLPAGLTATAISGTGWTPNLGALTATRSDPLAAGATYPAITITVSVATNATSLVTNLASVSGGGETNSANDSASDPTTIIALAPLQQWRLYYFGSTANGGTAADGAIASSDGIPNLLKYAWGLNPLVPTNSPVVGDISTGFLRLTSPKNPNATDVTFRVQVTGTLTNGWTTNGTTIDQNTSTLFQVHDNTPVGGATARYIRLQVSDP
jgi:uncharacterized repeat protein (TIGR01451 family)